MKTDTTDAIKQARKVSSMRGMVDVLADLKNNRPDIWDQVDLVGRWLWVYFDGKPDVATLDYMKNSGFRWNRKRACWQHSCGVVSRHSHGDPRTHYGSVAANRIDEKQLAVA